MHCLIELCELNSGHRGSSPFPAAGTPARNIALLLTPSVLAPLSRTQVSRVLPIALAVRRPVAIETQARGGHHPRRNTARAQFLPDRAALSAGNLPPGSPPLPAPSFSGNGPAESALPSATRARDASTSPHVATG